MGYLKRAVENNFGKFIAKVTTSYNTGDRDGARGHPIPYLKMPDSHVALQAKV